MAVFILLPVELLPTTEAGLVGGSHPFPDIKHHD